MGICEVIELLACPHCNGRLAAAAGGRSVQCARGHRFDLARQGYLNLLGRAQPANADTRDMVDARTRFLSRGLFDPIAAAAIDALSGHLCAGPSILDAGAGTGHLLATLLRNDADARGVALDVSTAAARQASRAHPRLGAVVADVWQPLPVHDSVIDLVVSNFAPRNPPEFARVVGASGHVLIISPTDTHLIELREAYGLLTVRPAKAARLAESLSGLFEPVTTRHLHRRGPWPAEAVAEAIAMGPNAFHDRTDRPAPVAAYVTLSVDLQLWRRGAR